MIPVNSRGLMVVVETYMAQSKGEEALVMLQAESQKAPKRVDFHLALATAAVLSGKFDVAVDQYQAVLGALGKDDKARADVDLRLGETYRRKGDLANSIASLQQARQM